jgi:hypothetical protein
LFFLKIIQGQEIRPSEDPSSSQIPLFPLSSIQKCDKSFDSKSTASAHQVALPSPSHVPLQSSFLPSRLPPSGAFLMYPQNSFHDPFSSRGDNSHLVSIGSSPTSFPTLNRSIPSNSIASTDGVFFSGTPSKSPQNSLLAPMHRLNSLKPQYPSSNGQQFQMTAGFPISQKCSSNDWDIRKIPLSYPHHLSSFGLEQNSTEGAISGMKRKKWTDEDMLRAIELVHSKKMSARAAAAKCNVPRSTLWDRLSGRVTHGSDCRKKRRMADLEITPS